jgi:hypothetical protein
MTISKNQSATAHIITTVDVPKRYSYKSYSGNTFLGLLPNVTSEFGFSQDINTAGAQITITVGVSADTSYLPSTNTIDDESGNTITDEASNSLLTEGGVSIVSIGTASQTLIKNGNRIVVYEYSKYYPNGKIMFNGIIEKWNASFSGSGGSNDISILCYSIGQDMDNRMISTGNTTIATQTLSSANIQTSQWGGAYAQVLLPTATTMIGIVDINLSIPGITSMSPNIQLCQGNPANDTYSVISGVSSYTFGSGNSLLATSSHAYVAGPLMRTMRFTFPSNVTLTGGTHYYLLLEVDSGSGNLVVYTAPVATTPVAPAGQLYYANASSNNVSLAPAYDANHPIMTFSIYKSGGNTIATYTSMDPSAMLTSIMDDYAGQGGSISYTASTIQSTGLSLTYTFNTNTSYEGIKSVLTLAPSGFYYYVDLGSNLLYFKQSSSSADVIVVKGRNIESINLIASTENIVNTVYFSGGIPSGQVSNLYRVYKDTASTNNSISL